MHYPEIWWKSDFVENSEKGFAFSSAEHIQRVGKKTRRETDMTKSKAKITLTQLELLRASMLAKPAKQKTEFTNGEAIKMLAPEIRSLIADGYTFEDIAGMFSEVDASISPSSIGACMRSVSKVSGDKTTTAKEIGRSLVAKRKERKTAIPPSEAAALTPAAHAEENALRLTMTSDNTLVVANTVPEQKPELDNAAPEIKKNDGNAPDVMEAGEEAHQELNHSPLPINKDQEAE